MNQLLSDTPICDSHIHLFRNGFTCRYDAAFGNRDEVALYQTLRTVHNIERAFVIGYEGEVRFKGNNSDICKWSSHHDWITPFEYFETARPPHPSYLNSEQHGVFAGIALFVSTAQEAQKLDDWPNETIDQLNARRSIISLNAEPGALGAMKGFLARLRDCFVLVSHLGMPGAFCQAPPQQEVRLRLEPLRRLSALPHVGVKVSGLYAISKPSHDYPHSAAHPFINQLRDDFGAKRLFWGSDFSPALEHVSFAQTIDAISHLNWPSEDVVYIMGANFKRLVE
jgi:L-fuconolactonase